MSPASSCAPHRALTRERTAPGRSARLLRLCFNGLHCWTQCRKCRGQATAEPFEPVTELATNTSVVIYIVVLIAVIVGVDLLFFRDHFWARLIANIGIVLVFAAFYLRFLRHA
jgi:hypothetical protein